MTQERFFFERERDFFRIYQNGALVELRCFQLPLIILETCPSALVSVCAKFSWLDMIGRLTPVYVRAHSWEGGTSESKPGIRGVLWGRIVWWMVAEQFLLLWRSQKAEWCRSLEPAGLFLAGHLNWGGLNGHMVSQFTFNTCANISSLFSFFASLVGGAVCGILSVKGEFNPFWNKAVTYKNVEKVMRYENNCHL